METSVRPPVSRPLTIRKTACRVGPASPKELFCAEALAGRCLRAPSPARGSRKDRPHAQECGLQAWGSPKGAWTSAALGLSEVWRPWSCLLAHGQEGIPGAAQGCFLPVGRLLASWPLLPEPPPSPAFSCLFFILIGLSFPREGSLQKPLTDGPASPPFSRCCLLLGPAGALQRQEGLRRRVFSLSRFIKGKGPWRLK